MNTTPLLFLDVDGTVLPMAGARLAVIDQGWEQDASPMLAGISTGIGARLLALRCELVWATAWMDDANEVITPILGLPTLRVADLGDVPGVDDPGWWAHGEGVGLSWKTRSLVALAAGRPFVWLDDEITDTDRDWVAEHHGGPALLHRVDPSEGLTEADLDQVGDWLRSQRLEYP